MSNIAVNMGGELCKKKMRRVSDRYIRQVHSSKEATLWLTKNMCARRFGGILITGLSRSLVSGAYFRLALSEVAKCESEITEIEIYLALKSFGGCKSLGFDGLL